MRRTKRRFVNDKAALTGRLTLGLEGALGMRRTANTTEPKLGCTSMVLNQANSKDYLPNKITSVPSAEATNREVVTGTLITTTKPVSYAVFCANRATRLSALSATQQKACVALSLISKSDDIANNRWAA